MALYGTRDAPLIWASEVASTLEGLGFRGSILHPSVYIFRLVDDFLISGSQEVLTWTRREIGKKYNVCGTIISNRRGDDDETKCLNRRSNWSTYNSTSNEGGDRHVKSLVAECGLDQCVPASSPLTKEPEDKVGSGPKLGNKAEYTVRRFLARINFMILDSLDITQASRILSEYMSKLVDGTKRALICMI